MPTGEVTLIEEETKLNVLQRKIIEISDLKKQLSKLNNDYMILNYKYMENRDIINRAIKS